MIKRYSLDLDAEIYDQMVEEDENGEWVKWEDVKGFISYGNRKPITWMSDYQGYE